MTQFVQSITDLCLPSRGIVDVLNKASQHDSPAVIKTASSIYKVLKRHLSIFLTWLHTTEELKSKGTTAQPIIESISKLLPERISDEKWCKKFRKTLKKDHLDLALLASQILPNAQQQQEEDEGADEVKEEEEGESSEKLNFPKVEEVISAQSKSKLNFITDNIIRLLKQKWFCK